MSEDSSRAQRRPHLLYVAWGYPPSRAGGVYRAWATANAFARNGWRVTVLTAPRETFTMSTGADLTLEARVDPSIRIVGVPFNAPGFSNDIRSWSFWRAQAPAVWSAINNRRGTRAFPERTYGGWRAALESAARRVHAADPVDLTIGTANPHIDFIPGYVLHKQSGVPYVMDYRDAWQLNVYNGERLSEPGSREDGWERKLITNAHRVWFVNDPIREWHVGQYPQFADRFEVVENGYDIAPALAPRTDELPKSGLVFGYIGTMSGQVPIVQTLDGWELARERSPLVRASRLDLYGYLSHMNTSRNRVMEDAMSRFEPLAVGYHGPLGKAELSSAYSGFDALLLLAGGGKYVTGGKAYEYAATGLPIASVHDPQADTGRVLAEYPGWRGVPTLGADDIAATFISVAEYAASQTEGQRAAARAWAERYERSAQLDPQVDRLTAEFGGRIEKAEEAA